MNRKIIKQGINAALRMASLGAKLGLSLYMGRYLGLAEIGEYGIVLGSVMMMTIVLGMRFDFVVSRDIAGTAPADALRKMRDQNALYMTNNVVFAAAMLLLYATNATGLDTKTLFFIFALSVAESFAGRATTNMVALGRPILSNALYFVYSASWILAAVALGLFYPEFRNSDTVLTCWFIGVLLSYVITFWVWRHLPWREVMRIPVDWAWIKKGVKSCFFIWLGSIGLAAGVYVDRFVVLNNLGAEMAGVATFYFSFANTLKILAQSGVLAFAYPRMIKFHREGDEISFKKEFKQSSVQVAVFSALIAAVVGTLIPLSGEFFGKRELAENAPTLWLLLLGMWLQANALSLNYVLFARHQDKAIWLGNLIFMIPAFGLNLLLVPIFGLMGIGYGSVVSSLFLLLWRAWHVYNSNKKINESNGINESISEETAEKLD